MSGTSMDAVDAVLVRINDDDLDIVAYAQYPIDKDIQVSVRNLDSKSPVSEVTRLDHIMGHLFADAVLSILDRAGMSGEEISAVGSHGQTVLHLPDDPHPRTLQIGNPDIIAERTRITTVAGFRGRDIAAGGQGAPLAPAFHAWYFHTTDKDRVILNIGGMANITWLPADSTRQISGFDTGPGNALLDDWTQVNVGQDFDRDGLWARSGDVDSDLLKLLLDDPYFSRKPPKSTGRDYFNIKWLRGKLSRIGHDLKNADIQATLLELSAVTISNAITDLAAHPEILVCGGGIHNTTLLTRLKALLESSTVQSTAVMGINPDAVEAVCFAWLARRRLRLEPGNLPTVTGAKASRILGTIYSAGSDD
ncbi:MAG TPA: anhydro-N-acetylmuramic acid kinase [Gammaproteobacteria bacterium]|nr:anhydro-N-acetylmuramic acid kinase [Gammaproteobacteria bacterium]